MQTIIKNGKIIDGSGKAAFAADIGINDGKISEIGNLKKAKAKKIVDAAGKFVAPGFIDIQNHSDVYWAIFDSPQMQSLVSQGITTVLMGNCGASLAPLISRDALFSIQKWHDLAGVNLNWLTFGEYLAELSKRKFGTNLAGLVGYSTLRRGLIKDNVRPLKNEEIKILNKVLSKSMEQGAFGLSSGLSYAHEAIMAESELNSLAQTVKESGGLFSIHLRSESSELVESVSEALELVSKFGVNMKISHFKAREKDNWHLLPQALALIEAAYQKHGNIHFDVYPYDFVWQVLYTYLPKWSYEGGRNSILNNLKGETQRRKMLAYLASRNIDYSQIFIASTAHSLNVAGKTIGEIAARHGTTSEESLLDIIENGGSEVLVFEKNLDEKQVRELLAHPLGMVATDGAGFSTSTQGRLVHPRCFGSMPKFLHLALSENLMPVGKAVQKLTSIPAAKIGLQKRGQLKKGYFADICIFSADVKDAATRENPFRFSQGISYVFVNGEPEFENGNFSASSAGIVLKK